MQDLKNENGSAGSWMGIFLIGKLTPHDGSKSAVKEFKPMHCMTEVKRNPEVLLFDIVAKNIIWLVEIPSVVLLIGKEVRPLEPGAEPPK